jgi:hypothetical protein
MGGKPELSEIVTKYPFGGNGKEGEACIKGDM